jgi:hypothetical protein
MSAVGTIVTVVLSSWATNWMNGCPSPMVIWLRANASTAM